MFPSGGRQSPHPAAASRLAAKILPLHSKSSHVVRQRASVARSGNLKEKADQLHYRSGPGQTLARGLLE